MKALFFVLLILVIFSSILGVIIYKHWNNHKEADIGMLDSDISGLSSLGNLSSSNRLVRHRHPDNLRRSWREEPRINLYVTNDEIVGNTTIDITDYLRAGR